jgi:peptidoglycan/LPS O-acetylase OafA/YrhL
MAALIGDKVSHPVFFAIYLPASILSSWVFYLAVEVPFMTMSREFGRTAKVVPAQHPGLETVRSVIDEGQGTASARSN